MILKTYRRVWIAGNTDYDGEWAGWSYDPIDGQSTLAPGVAVEKSDYTGRGMIIAISKEQLTILWSILPKSPAMNEVL